MSIADATETLLLNWLFNQGAPTRPTTYYLAIHDSAPNDAGVGGEQDATSDTAYDRTAITFGSAAADGVISNTAALTHTPAVAAADFTVTYVSIWDDTLTNGGNCLFTAALAVSRTINNGSPLSFAIGDINVSLD